MSNVAPKLVIVRGIPGGGKSYLALSLQAALGQDNVVILDPDAIDKESSGYKQLSAQLSADGVDQKFHPFRYLRAQAHQAIDAGKVLLWTQAFNDFAGFKITVDKLIAYAHEQGKDLPVLVVEVEISRAVARTRIDERAHRGGHYVPDERLDQFFADYKSFAGQGYKTITVNGEVAAALSTEQVLKAL